MKESYLIVIIPALININLLRFKSFGEALNSTLCLIFILLMLIIPYTIHKFMKKKRTALENKWIKKKYSVIYSQPSIIELSEGKIRFEVFFYLRRIMLANSVVWFRGLLVFQFFIFVMCSIAQIIFIGTVVPFKTK